MEANLFTLVSADDRNAIFAFGMEIISEDRTEAVVYRRDPDTGRTFVGQHRSAEAALRRYTLVTPLELVWDYEEMLA